MSDEPQQTYSAREIVLELFPATHERLIPATSDYRVGPDAKGDLALYDPSGEQLLTLAPVASAGNATTQLCCDFCQRTGSRHYLRLFRVEVPGSSGRRYRYVSLCRDAEGCNVRRLNDEPIRALLARVLDSS